LSGFSGLRRGQHCTMKLEDNSQRNASLPLLHFTKFMRRVRDSMEEKDETVRPDC